jgi:hypothetical protein
MRENDKEIMNEQIEDLVEIQKVLLGNDKLFQLGAEICKKSYDNLIKVGFCRDEAVRIIAGGGMSPRKS